MIDKQLLTQAVNEAVDEINAATGSDIFVVDITVDPQNDITVELDSSRGLDIDTCVAVNRAVEARFDRDADDYQLEVGSAGLTSPFKVPRQFANARGEEVEVLTADGRKLHGLLKAVTDEGFTLTRQEKQRLEGEKRPKMVEVDEQFPFEAAKKVCRLLKF